MSNLHDFNPQEYYVNFQMRMDSPLGDCLELGPISWLCILTVSTEWEAGNSVLTASVLHWLAAIFFFFACSPLFYAYKASTEIWRNCT